MKKILIIADEENYLYFKYNLEALADIDFIISCGDLPLDYLEYVQKLTQKKIYYVNGNHSIIVKSDNDNIISLDDKVIDVMGIKIAGIDGTMQKQYARVMTSVDKFLSYENDIDIFVTHSPSENLGDGDGSYAGVHEFKKLYEKKHIKYHFYGHYHLTYGGTRFLSYGKTKLYNAFDHYIVNYEE